MRLCLLTLLFALLNLSFGSLATAQIFRSRSAPAGSGFVLQNAETFYRDSARKLIVLKGNVQVVYDGQHLSCDRATIYESTNEIEAEGNLKIQSQTFYVEGDRARFNYKTGEGVIYNGFVRSGQVVFEGRIVRKTGPEEFEAETAYYTACTTCPPAWSFTGSKIRAKLGGYAYIRNSVLEIAHFPVFWLPYLIVPLKSDRQTGFLIPSFDFSGQSGTAISQSFFWAIDRSQDATFTLKNYSFRGLKGLTNYRYVLSETSEGEANFAFIQDRMFAGDLVSREVPNPPSRFNRWFFTFKNTYDLPENFTFKSNIALTSDLLYLRDFPEELPGWGDPAIENRVSLSKNYESTHISVDASHYTNTLKTNPIADNSDAVHRLPELRFSLLEKPLPAGFFARFDANYVNFARENFAFDDVVGIGPTRSVDTRREGQGAGQFDPRGLQDNSGNLVQDPDLIRAGQRLDLQPEISRPFLLGNAIDVLPSFNYRFTQYGFNVNPPTDRFDPAAPANPPSGLDFDTTPIQQYLRARLSMRTRFTRVFGLDVDQPKDERVRHEVEPEVSFSSLPWVQQANHPFIGRQTSVPAFREAQPVSDFDFRSGQGIQFDYFDRIPPRNVVTFGLNNRLIEKRWLGETPDYRQVVNWRIQQSYDFDQAAKDTGPKYPWSDILTLLDVRYDRWLTNATLRYFPYHNKTNTSSRVRWTSLSGQYLETRFEQSFTITENLDEADYSRRRENIGFGAGFFHKFVGLEGSVETEPRALTFKPDPTGTNQDAPSPFSLKVKSWAANLVVRPPGECWIVQIRIRQDIGAEPIYKFQFEYNFGGANL